jgi:hypothetical protein
MKIAFVTFLVLLLFACSKNKRMINSLEGTWHFYDVLHYDGSHSYPNETLIFEKGEADGKSFLPLTVYSNDTINGSYLIAKKGDYIYFKKQTQNTIDTCSVEDFGKTLLVARYYGEVWYFKKLK